MPVICPTVTAFDPHEYRAQMERLQPFARRIHIDLMDGEFAPTKSPDLEQIWWPDGITADIHLMYMRPQEQLAKLIELKPHLVVIHQEAQGDLLAFADELRESGIKAGLAVLQNTSIDTISTIIKNFDHVLVFSGDLGHHGGQADMSLLGKVRRLREDYPELEISWDGGINDQNAKQLVEAGVDVLNVGGFIQKSENPQNNYDLLVNLS